MVCIIQEQEEKDYRHNIPGTNTRGVERPGNGTLRDRATSGQEELRGILLDLLTAVSEGHGHDSKEDDRGDGQAVSDRDQRHGFSTMSVLAKGR
jgi:hypothetical protein